MQNVKQFSRGWAAWLLTWLIVCNVLGQTGSLVHLRVISDDDNEALPGAHILLRRSGEMVGTTGSNGDFSIQKSLLNEEDTLEISFVGFEQRLIPVRALRPGTIIISMRPGTAEMEEVVISAEKLIAEEFSIEKIRKIEVYLNPNAKADPLLAVNSMAAATTTDESANVSLRGSSPAETGIFFDNVPIYDAVRFSQLNGIGTFSIFNTSIVNNVQVYPGNPPLEYGNTTSGLIAIQSEDDIPKVNTNSAVISLANFGLTATRRIRDNTSLTLFSNGSLAGGLIGLNDAAFEDLKDFKSLDFGLHYVVNVGTSSKIKIFNYALLESYDFTFRNPSFVGNFAQRRRRNFTVGSYRRRFRRSEFSINQGFSISRSEFDYSRADLSVLNTDYYGSVNYMLFAGDWTMKSGLTFDRRRSSFDGFFPQYDFAIGPNHPYLAETATALSEVPEFYLYNKYALSDDWILGLGVRKNIDFTNGKSYWSGQGNIHHKFTEKKTFNASIGQYHKRGLGSDEDGRSINGLITSRQVSLDLNIDGSKGQRQLAVFAKRTIRPSDVAEVFGVEVYWSHRFSHKLNGSLSYSYINAQIEANGTTYPSRYDMNYFVKGNLSYNPAANWTVSMVFLLRHGTYFEPISSTSYRADLEVFEPHFFERPQGTRYPDYKVVDLSVSKLIPISEQLTMVVFGNTSNVLDFKNIRTYSYNFDYSNRRQNLFGRRIVYVGCVLNF